MADKTDSAITYHFGLLVDLTIGDIPSRYRDLVLLKLTMLNITLCNKTTQCQWPVLNCTVHIFVVTNIHIYLKSFCDFAVTINMLSISLGYQPV